jgi:hypothetical protein
VGGTIGRADWFWLGAFARVIAGAALRPGRRGWWRGSRPRSSEQTGLAEGFVGGDAGGGAQVERAQVGVGVGDFHAVFDADLVVQPVGRAGAFVAKDEAVTVGKLGGPEILRGFRRKQPQAARGDGAGAKRGPVGVFVHIERIPVVHAGAAQVAVVDRKSERVDEVQPRARERAHPADVAGILWDFWREKDDVQHVAQFHETPWGLKSAAWVFY